MGDAYPITPVDVEPVETAYRTIRSPIPHPETVPILERLRHAEPWCMEGQPPIVWDHAEGATVHDGFGNRWIDFTSGVLITNAGHGRRPMARAVAEQAERPLLTSYCFPQRPRADLVERLRQWAPREDDRVMLLSTGSEAVELCIKLARERARRSGRVPNVLVSFHNAFHGRTLGAQLAGGISGQKAWIGYDDPHFVHVPFPDGVRCEPDAMDFSSFDRALAAAGVAPEQVCGVLSETYQGGDSTFAPVEYMQSLRRWCDAHDAVLILDEVQAGFGRTGRRWGFDHYGIAPDLIACGKGISGSLPLSAVIGRRELLDQFPPGSMTSTHSGNPVCCAAARSHLDLIEEEGLVDRAASLGPILEEGCRRIRDRFRDRILAHCGKGLVASLHGVGPSSTEPDPRLGWEVAGRAAQRGLLLFAPVGTGGASVKLCPPLVIEEEALREGLSVLEEAFADVLSGHHPLPTEPSPA